MYQNSEDKNTRECVYRKVGTEILYLIEINSTLGRGSQINTKNEDEHYRYIKC